MSEEGLDGGGEKADEGHSVSGLRLKTDFLEALRADFAIHGADVIAACRADDPLQYIKLIASLLPKAGPTDSGGGVHADELARLSDQELLARIRSLEAAIDASTSASHPVSELGPGAGRTQTPDRYQAAAVLPPLR